MTLILPKKSVPSVLGSILFFLMVTAANAGDGIQRSVIDVGENGVCMYGHWLSGKVEVRLEGCNVFIGGFMAFPRVPETGVSGKDLDCSDIMRKKVLGRFQAHKRVMELGGFLYVSSYATTAMSKSVRNSDETREAIQEAVAAKAKITPKNWNSFVFSAVGAEQLRNPMSVELCGGF